MRGEATIIVVRFGSLVARSAHLEVLHGVPVMFKEDDSVCTSQVESQSSYVSGQQKNVHRWIHIEPWEREGERRWRGDVRER